MGKSYEYVNEAIWRMAAQPQVADGSFVLGWAAVEGRLFPVIDSDSLLHSLAAAHEGEID